MRGERTFAWWLMTVLAGVVAFYALGHFVLGEAIFADVLAESFTARPWGIYPHAFFGMIGILLGPFQLLPSSSGTLPARHRLLGKLYVGAALLTGGTGLYMAVYAQGSAISQLGFAGMAAPILVTKGMAWRLILRREVAAHRRWMIRSYAVLFSAVTLRLWLPIFVVVFGGAFTPAYR